jgi:glyoxylase-like metal-dependent hydrolase (beta-lactamase superfamily II)
MARSVAAALQCEVGGRSILIDGGKRVSGRRTTGAGITHPSIPEQLKALLGQPEGAATAAHVDLLVLTHCHSDHIGCLPELVTRERLTCDWALMADPDLGFGRLETDPDEPEPDAMPLARKIAFALSRPIHPTSPV